MFFNFLFDVRSFTIYIDVPIKINYLSAGKYSLEIETEDGKKGEQELKTFLEKIEKKSKKKCLDMVITGFYPFYEKKILNKTKLFSKEKYPIETVGIKRYRNMYYSKESYDALCIMAKNEGMTKKRCLDNIVLWFYSYYMGYALRENNIRREMQ